MIVGTTGLEGAPTTAIEVESYALILERLPNIAPTYRYF
jgi:hypothetical protein